MNGIDDEVAVLMPQVCVQEQGRYIFRRFGHI